MKTLPKLFLTVATALTIASLAPATHAQQQPTPAQMMKGFLSEVGVSAETLAKEDSEGPVLVSIDFEYELPETRFIAEMEGNAAFLAEFPGLIWKVWGHDKANGIATGSYLFISMKAADVYTQMLFPNGPPKKEGYSKFDIVKTRVLEGASRVTRAPID